MFQAWKSWREGRTLELIDTCLKDSCILPELECCFHISFLCLQQHHEYRLNMSFVVIMLHSESSLLELKEPGFYVGKKNHLHRARTNHPQAMKLPLPCQMVDSQASYQFDNITYFVINILHLYILEIVHTYILQEGDISLIWTLMA